MNRNPILVQEWEEVEENSIFKHAGYSLHLNELVWNDYIENVWKTYPKEIQEHIYRPKGLYYKAFVPEDVYQEILESRFGIRIAEAQPSWIKKE